MWTFKIHLQLSFSSTLYFTGYLLQKCTAHSKEQIFVLSYVSTSEYQYLHDNDNEGINIQSIHRKLLYGDQKCTKLLCYKVIKQSIMKLLWSESEIITTTGLLDYWTTGMFAFEHHSCNLFTTIRVFIIKVLGTSEEPLCFL